MKQHGCGTGIGRLRLHWFDPWTRKWGMEVSFGPSAVVVGFGKGLWIRAGYRTLVETGKRDSMVSSVPERTCKPGE